jgi:hypothetical protein
MRIKLTEEIIKQLHNGTKISKKNFKAVIDGNDILVSKFVKQAINVKKCGDCGTYIDEIKISDKPINVNNHIVHTFRFFNNDVEFFNNGAKIICASCKSIREKIKKESYYDDDEYYYDTGYYEAELKNYELVSHLEDSRESFCGIGTRKIKLKLNKLIKDGNIDAKILRSLLELEDCNISAKKYVGKYRTKYYDKKSALLKECIGLYNQNDLVCGFQKSDNYSCNYVIYFEYGNVQLSWHSNSNYNLKKYPTEWDGLENSTLYKLEKLINELLTSKGIL